ncbi:MAG: flagellar protein FlaG [Thermincolia bacterium]
MGTEISNFNKVNLPVLQRIESNQAPQETVYPKGIRVHLIQGEVKEPIDKAQLEEILKKLNLVMETMQVELRFQIHEITKDIMVTVVNQETGKTIREVPPKKILDMVAQMMKMVGLLFDEKI